MPASPAHWMFSEVVAQPITMGTDYKVLMELARENEIHVRDDMELGTASLCYGPRSAACWPPRLRNPGVKVRQIRSVR